MTTEQIGWEEITHYAGFDWAKDHHNVVVVDRQGKILKDLTFEHSAEGWSKWNELMADCGKLAVAIETNQGAAIDVARRNNHGESGYGVFAVISG